MIRRSSMMIAVLVSLLLAGTADARPQTPLSEAGAKARTRQVMAQERDNKWKAREKIGGAFTLSLKYCQLRYASSKPWRASCAYFITSVKQTSTAQDGSAVHRRCVVNVEVRKSPRTGRITHTRTPGKCYEPQPPVVGPPVNPRS